jgi:hypothetical protein
MNFGNGTASQKVEKRILGPDGTKVTGRRRTEEKKSSRYLDIALMIISQFSEHHH